MVLVPVVNKDYNMSCPEPGYVTEARVIKIIDGDTIDVEIKRIVRVRLSHPNPKNLDFNAPEKNTVSGMEALKFLGLWLLQSPVTVFFPAKSPDILLDNTSFNRIIGEVWCGGNRVTQRLLDLGYGKLSKRGKYDEGNVGNTGPDVNAN